MTIVDRPPQEREAVPQPRRPRSVPPEAVVGAILVLTGGLWLLERIDAVGLNATAILALATFGTGVSLMALSRRAAHGGLIVFGTLLAVVTAVTAVAPIQGFNGGVGDRTVEVLTLDEIRPEYNLAMGKMVLDLSAIESMDQEAELTARVGLGELIVLVPPGTEVSVEATTGAGQVEILGRVVDGLGVEDFYRTPGFTEGAPGLVLHLEAFLGRVEVSDG